MNKEFFTRNRANLLKRIKDNSILVLFSGEAPQKSADEDYSFTPNRNFYYLTGVNREKTILMITKIDDKVSQTLFIEKADPVVEKWVGKRMTVEEAKEASGIDNIKLLDGFESVLGRYILSYDVKRLYLDLESRGWDSVPTRANLFARTVFEKYPQIKIKNIYHDICNLRVIKGEEEIVEIKKAIEITYEGIKSLMNNARPGMLEYQIEANFDYVLKCSGVTDYAFKTIAASGVNGTVLHYSKNNANTQDGDLILFDLGAQWKYYNADISRTFPVNGKFTERQKEIYNIVLKAMEDTMAVIKPGVPFSKLNEATKLSLAESLKKIGLINEDSELSKYYYHGVSHYLGLDTHDVGDGNTELKSGMVLTVEPGLYIEEEKIGIRIEDDVLVTESGYENLSKDIIKTVEDIEQFMNR
ncbi:aminopeptidase P family protein [Clostridium swellfunianum]|uniref:aminopeptidase P family protein n=1 Tax=Clostridium swellfunianum TaxID=1367462 RepID=UPI00202DFD5E|nr:aminopeptidase P family protein [Clostridium swellfunianum]MCM0650328.1 aminopeptidase P family protein [Clostridium swellfunianum]